MMRPETGTKLLLVAGLLLCMLQIWLPAYYLTGDGPSHVYNAQILHDMWADKHTSFYAPYYSLSYQPNPNWLSGIIIALLMFLVNGVVAEKLFLTIYVLLYVSGAVLLLKKMTGGYSYWLPAIFLLVFPLTLSKGFYNFSFSIAFFYWVVWSWLRFMDKRNVGNAVLFLLFTALIFFTHLLAFGMAAFTCAALLVSYTIAVAKGTAKEKFTGYLLKNGLLLTLFLSPFIILMGRFTENQGGMQLVLRHHFYRAIELVQCKFLVNVTHEEDIPALIAGIVLVSLFVFTFIKFKNYRTVHKYDGLVLGLLFASFIYLFFPESFLGRLILINMRLQLFVLLFIICCIAYVLPGGKVKNAAGLILFSCFVVLSIARTNCQLKASEGAVDYLSAGSYIQPYSVVLPIDLSRNGKDENGRVIADRNFLFVHTAQYLGTTQPLIVLDNYEANMGYFPLAWKERTSPYSHLGIREGDDGGIEGEPPSADIAKYRQESGVMINYIIVWCYDPSFLSKGYFSTLYEQIRHEYHVIYTSASKRTILFEKN
ncbi:MAG: hypothetical protein JWQ38_1270 [Flavipsychrobacter sp.]|nr:hypothetical protein [Flavipsychrobacter sp.]